MGKAEWGGNPHSDIGFVFLLCLLFRWGILHRVLLVFEWCWVLYSIGFLCVSSHYLILPRRQWHPTPVLLPGKSHGRRSLVGCRPWGHEELDTTEWLHFDFSLSCIGEGNGNPLQYSCLENPRDGRAWWAAVYGVAQSRTWLKRLSSSSSIFLGEFAHAFIYDGFTVALLCAKYSDMHKG